MFNSQGHAGMSMTPHIPSDETRHIVEVLVGGGTPNRTIAKALNIGMNTLRRYYGKELEGGHEIANAKVVRRLFRLIEQGSTPATIFWLKARAGWKEGQVVEVAQKAAEPAYDFSVLTDAERNELRAKLVAVIGRTN
jgi:transposase